MWGNVHRCRTHCRFTCQSSEKSISASLRERLWNNHQGTNSSHLKKKKKKTENSCKFKGTLQNLGVKLRGIAEVGMRQREWWSVKMYWALPLRECGQQPGWRQQWALITASTRNQRGTCGGSIGKSCISSNSCWLAPGAGAELLAATVSTISPPALRYFVRNGDVITFPISLHKTSPVKSKKKKKKRHKK